MRDLNNDGSDELQAKLTTMIAKTDLKLTRRQMMSGAASAGLLLAAPVSKALAQARVTVTEGNFQPIPIAIPNFVPGTQGDN
ncbi:MAG: Tol-Pal system protein TolB, partial [Afipia sp.]